MVFKIVWSSLAIQTYAGNIAYLEKAWSKKEVSNFISATERKLEILKNFPGTGYSSKKNPYLKKPLIGNVLYLSTAINRVKIKLNYYDFLTPGRTPKK